MAKLTDLGFLKSVTFETIVSTYNPDGTPNAAPMGVIMQNPQTITLKIYNTSITNRNLRSRKCAAINITSDIDLFYKTTFMETNLNGKLKQEWFEKASVVNAPKLRLANATIEVLVTDIVAVDQEKTEFKCSVERVETTKIHPQAYSRAMALTLEAIIHATRVKQFGKDKAQQERVNRLLALIENSNDVVNRVAPNSVYSNVMADLMNRLDSWMVKQ